jgi:hypothetical protein
MSKTTGVVGTVPKNAVGLRLYRITGKGDSEKLHDSSAVIFEGGSASLETVLRRSSLGGIVHIGGKLQNYFCDLLDVQGDIVASVALDAGSYRALKYRWAKV